MMCWFFEGSNYDGCIIGKFVHCLRVGVFLSEISDLFNLVALHKSSKWLILTIYTDIFPFKHFLFWHPSWMIQHLYVCHPTFPRNWVNSNPNRLTFMIPISFPFFKYIKFGNFVKEKKRIFSCGSLLFYVFGNKLLCRYFPPLTIPLFRFSKMKIGGNV